MDQTNDKKKDETPHSMFDRQLPLLTPFCFQIIQEISLSDLHINIFIKSNPPVSVVPIGKKNVGDFTTWCKY